jgi:predicted transcriptional regulator
MEIVSKNVSVTKVLRTLSDQKTQNLLTAIIEAEAAQSHLLIAELGISRRQYYNRITELVTTGLIRRQRGRYRLTSFGKVIHSLQKIAEKAASSYWKLEAIDSIRMSDNSHLAEIDLMKIVDILLDDVEIKDIYLHDDTFSDIRTPQENDRKQELLISALN